MKKIFTSLAILVALFGTTLMTTVEATNMCAAPVFAAPPATDGGGGNTSGGDGSGGSSGGGNKVEQPSASILKNCASQADDNGAGITCILSLLLTIMTYGVGILGVIGIILSGIQYTMSQGDPSKMAKAKNRLLQVIIGLIVYALMWAGLRFLVPGFEL